MLYSTLFTIAAAVLASAAPAEAAPAKKNPNQFTIRPKLRTDLCIDVQPAPGETAAYTLLKPCKKVNGRFIDSQVFWWDTQKPDADPYSFLAEPIHSGYSPDGVPACLSTSSPDGTYPGVVPVVDHCPAKDSEEYDYYKWQKIDVDSLMIYRRRGLRPGLRMLELTREDNNQTSLVAALKSLNSQDNMSWMFIKV